jgi:hypothetical protein
MKILSQVKNYNIIQIIDYLKLDSKYFENGIILAAYLRNNEMFFNDYYALFKKTYFSSKILDTAKFNTNELIRQYKYLSPIKELKWKKL